MSLQRRRVLFGAALVAGAAFAGSPAWSQKNFDLTMGIIVSPGDAYTAMTQSVPERIKKATNGRVSVTVSDSLVAPAQIASAVRDGRLPMSAALHTYLAADEPRMGIFNLPGLIDNIDDFHKVRKAFWAKDTAQIWADKWGAVVLAEGAWCPTRLFSKTPIHTVEDFKNKRFRVHNPQTAALLNALGGKPTPMSVPEIMPGARARRHRRRVHLDLRRRSAGVLARREERAGLGHRSDHRLGDSGQQGRVGRPSGRHPHADAERDG